MNENSLFADPATLFLGVVVILLIGAAVFLVVFLMKVKALAAKAEHKKNDLEQQLIQAKREREMAIKDAIQEAKDLAKKETEAHEARQQKKNLELQNTEKRIQKQEDMLNKKLAQVEEKDKSIQKYAQELAKQEENLKTQLKEVQEKIAQSDTKIEEIAGLSRQDAREQLHRSLEKEVRRAAATELREMEDEARKQADIKARSIIATSIQRLANEFVSDACISVITLPNDAMKGRIIGREGRNIRAIEQATGVDLIIDDTPEAILISCFNPIRREIAKVSIDRLIADGRIHPARIDEVVGKVQSEFETLTVEAGEKAAFDCGIQDLHPEVIHHLGQLKFKTTGQQSVLQHSIETSQIAGIIAAELGADQSLAKRAGLLHEIGKSLDETVEGGYSDIGADFVKRYGEDKVVQEAIRKQHRNQLHGSDLICVILQSANSLSRFRPGARKEFLEKAIGRMLEVEESIKKFEGVDEACVIRSGKEIRALINPVVLDDEAVTILANKVASSVRSDINFPGQVKVTMIRESRFTDYAR